MVAELLVEIGCEEIPARFLPAASQQLKQNIQRVLTDHSLGFEEIDAYSTPRRLIVHASGVAASQPARSQVITGPPMAIAFDRDGRPAAAALGFARKNQVEVEALSQVETKKGSYLAYRKQVPGRGAKDILAEEIPNAIKGLDLPKSMRWEASRFLFLRPIRWILCLFGGEVVPVQLASVRAADRTYGHRILAGNREAVVTKFADYRQKLREADVEIDSMKRLGTIQAGLAAAAQGQGGHLVEDRRLLQAVAHLSEHPSVVCGDFDPEFLNLPAEVLITVMREHQKYFSLRDRQGKLLPKFLAVVDSDEAYSPQVQAGHERVLRARLSDAAFFWESDLKISLQDRMGLLKKITYQRNLGTLYDKTLRIKALSKFMVEGLQQPELLAPVQQAAELCKTDLTTEMVREFSNLQGIMGGLYGRAQGIEAGVSEAIYDHYLPVASEDGVPRGLAGAVVAMADKLDTLAGAFCLGLAPTGSRDPLGLRRQAMGLLRILLVKELDLSCQGMLSKAYEGVCSFADRSLEETSRTFGNFLKDRMRFLYREQGFRYDEINAVLEVCWDNPVESRKRLAAIAGMRESADFQSLATSFKRIKNILLKAEVDPQAAFAIDPARFATPEEHLLHRQVVTADQGISGALREGRHEAALGMMASLRPAVDSFFDRVLVMDEDPGLRRNRLALLTFLLQTFLKVADVSEMVTA